MSWSESLRYIYPLNTDSFVIDLGGYEGEFAVRMHEIYACEVSCYEPIKKFYEKCKENAIWYPYIHVINRGAGNSNRMEELHLEDNSTGKFATGAPETIRIQDIKDIIGDKFVDLLKLNIEGMEYEVLERIIECNLQRQIGNIQVQFHKIGPSYEEKYKNIYNTLLETHELTYDFPFMWQSFRLKSKNVV
jgi:FkbM family methyltransferase